MRQFIINTVMPDPDPASPALIKENRFYVMEIAFRSERWRGQKMSV